MHAMNICSLKYFSSVNLRRRVECSFHQVREANNSSIITMDNMSMKLVAVSPSGGGEFKADLHRMKSCLKRCMATQCIIFSPAVAVVSLG